MSFCPIFWPEFFQGVAPVFAGSEINSASNCHDRKGGNLGGNRLTDPGRDGPGVQNWVILHNNARTFLFLGKDRCGSSFPPLSLLLPECPSKRLIRKLSGMGVKAGLPRKLGREFSRPDRPINFSAAKGKKN